MKRLCRIPLLAAAVVAAMVSACSDGTEPTGVTRPSPQANGAASRALEFFEPGRFTTTDMPGAATTQVFAINDEGVSVGRYLSAGRTHGFVRSATGEFTTLDFPGSGFTVAGALNNRGDIVGWYTLLASPAIRHGFLLRDGEFTTFDPPGSIFTNTLGINDRGDIVGRFCTKTVCREPGGGDFHAFLLHNGEFTILDIPGSNETNAWKISDRGEILGAFGAAGTGVQVFLNRNGDVTTFALPNGKPLSEDNGGLNAQGDIVGKYCDASPCLIGPGGHGFLFSGGRLTTIDIPGSLGMNANGINSRHEVVGAYFDAAGVLHGYLLRL